MGLSVVFPPAMFVIQVPRPGEGLARVTLRLAPQENFAAWWRIHAYVVGPFCFLRTRVIFTVMAETTPGVYQASGYGDLAPDKSVWFVL